MSSQTLASEILYSFSILLAKFSIFPLSDPQNNLIMKSNKLTVIYTVYVERLLIRMKMWEE